jgi:hypothetical protein
MDVLFDQGVPVPLRRHLPDCRVVTAFERGWQMLANGELLAAAEEAGFQTLVTTDSNLRYQQNLTGRRIAILVLSTTDWRRIRRHTTLVAEALAALSPGAYVELSIPSA